MRIVLFDLGHTLEADGVLLPGAHHALQAVQSMMVDGGPVRLALLSDYRMPDGVDTVAEIMAEYIGLLEQLGIGEYFAPVEERVTLSTELRVFKPDPKLFRHAADKILPGISFQQVTFVTENGSHVAAASALGMVAFQVSVPGSSDDLPGLAEVAKRIAAAFGIPPPSLPEPSDSVRLARGRIPSDPNARSADSAYARAASWVRMGRDVLLIDGAELGEVSRAGPAAVPLEGKTPRRDHLHVVRQKGRLFQRLNPSVDVLHDSGRFLVVDISPDEVLATDSHGHSHFEVAPLLENEVLFSLADIDAAREAPKSTIQVTLDEFDTDRFRHDLEELVGLGTRHSVTDGYTRALELARDRLRNYATRLQSFAMPGGTSANLIADKPGTAGSDRDLILVTAHLDSVNLEDGPTGAAPGADDNGSGAAGVLAIGRALEPLELRHDVRFVLFGGEEQGLIGSREYLSRLSNSERHRIRAVLNMDMIGAQHGPRPGVLLESSPMALWLLRELTRAAATYTKLEVQISTNPFASDHVPFLNAGIPAVLTIEATDELSQDFIHSSRDTLDRVDDELASAILQMNTAWIIDTAKS